MRVLMQIRPDATSLPGGDIVQILKTREYLEKIGVHVDVTSKLNPDVKQYDVVHLFSLDFHFYDNYARYQNARRQRKPVVLSPIYWSPRLRVASGLTELVNFKEKIYYALPDGVIRDILSTASHTRVTKELAYVYLRELMSLNFYKRKDQVEFLRGCDLVLPNSEIEVKQIMNDFGTFERHKFFVVPNAADASFQNANPEPFVSQYGTRDFVLCVGRIEPRKNQLSLIRALKGTSLKLVLIGPPKKTAMEYYHKCRREADRSTLFIDWIPHEKLSSAYAAARVHALPSWCETPGLVSLEAGLAGCNIVTTLEGSAKEYLADYAWYCRPESVGSIKDALKNAYLSDKSSALKEHILKHFTWERAAERTLEAYETVLNH